MEPTKKTKIEIMKEQQIQEKHLKTDNKDIENAEKEIAKEVTKLEDKVEGHKITQKRADKEIKQEVKEEVAEIKETEKQGDKKTRKTEAVVNAKSLPISTKHSIAICNFIRGKDIDEAISMLEQVEQMKRAIPLRGEIPHRKGKGMMSGRYLTKAVGHFIKILKSLKANSLINELELEKYEIFCKANLASRPYRRFGRGRFKRTHVTLKLIPTLSKRLDPKDRKIKKEIKRKEKKRISISDNKTSSANENLKSLDINKEILNTEEKNK